MAGLGPAIHGNRHHSSVDARNKPGMTMSG